MISLCSNGIVGPPLPSNAFASPATNCFNFSNPFSKFVFNCSTTSM